MKISGGEMIHNGRGGEKRGKEHGGGGNEGVRGEGERGEEDHGERSCFYSLLFLAEAKDTLSTDGVYLLGQTAFYCILLYCIVLCSVMCGCLYIITTLLLSVYSNQENTLIYCANSQRWVCAHTHARTHLTTHNQQL